MIHRRQLAIVLLALPVCLLAEPVEVPTDSIKPPFTLAYKFRMPGIGHAAVVARQKAFEAHLVDLQKREKVSQENLDSLRKHEVERCRELEDGGDGTVTISSNGSRLLYRYELDGKVKTVAIVADRTWNYEAENQRVFMDRGIHLENFVPWPYLPFSLPGMKLYRPVAMPPGRSVEEFHLTPNQVITNMIRMGARTDVKSDVIYAPAILTVTPSTGDVSEVHQDVDKIAKLSNYRACAGVRVPGRIVVESHKVENPAGPPPFKLSARPTGVFEMTLESCQESSVPEKEFVIDNYLNEGAALQSEQKATTYQKRLGSADQQIDRMLRGRITVDPKGKSSGGSEWLLPIGIGAILIAAAGFLRKGRKSQ